jgi:hypothetical protein
MSAKLLTKKLEKREKEKERGTIKGNITATEAWHSLIIFSIMWS